MTTPTLMDLFKEHHGRFPRGNVQDELREWAASRIVELEAALVAAQESTQ